MSYPAIGLPLNQALKIYAMLLQKASSLRANQLLMLAVIGAVIAVGSHWRQSLGTDLFSTQSHNYSLIKMGR